MFSNPHRLAWTTLISALLLFLVLCLGIVAFSRWLLLESPTQLNVTLHVGRGTVGLAQPDQTGEQAIRSPIAVSGRDRLTTDSEAQGYLAFTDPYSEQVVATVLMRNDSQMTLSTANRPRFNFSENDYIIRLTGLDGRFEVWVSRNLERDIQIDLVGPVGTTRISEQGFFLIDSSQTMMHVMARRGSAILVNRGTNTAQHIAAAHEGLVQLETEGIRLDASPVELLENNLFTEGLEGDWPVGWVCGFVPRANEAARGEYRFTTEDGRSVVHITRMMPNPQPGDMACFQTLGGAEGLDVTQFDSLRLHVTMKINHQSLNQCGVAGSECPLMLNLTYQVPGGDSTTVTRDWYHGFYIERRENEGGRDVCDSCLQPHEQISPGTWYSYESQNLLSDLPETWRPIAVNEVRFYAGGHQYDVVVSEVSLIATKGSETVVLVPDLQ